MGRSDARSDETETKRKSRREAQRKSRREATRERRRETKMKSRREGGKRIHESYMGSSEGGKEGERRRERETKKNKKYIRRTWAAVREATRIRRGEGEKNNMCGSDRSIEEKTERGREE